MISASILLSTVKALKYFTKRLHFGHFLLGHNISILFFNFLINDYLSTPYYRQQ